jgi:hypothetical protein
MKTLNECRQILSQDIADMRGIERTDGFFRTALGPKRVQEVGWHCYQAEEHLSMLELQQLKHELEITEIQWRWYKTAASLAWPAGPLARMRFLCIQRKTFQGGNRSSPWVIAWLRLLRKACQAHHLQEQIPENNRLEFARWLYLQGRIREDMQHNGND